MENKVFKVHFFYIISILIGVIVVLISVKWGNIGKLVDYITFALTLTSLVLALLAIVYAVFSNSKFTGNITTLTNISMDVKQASSSLKNVSEELRDKIEEIPSSIKGVESRTIETQELIKEMNAKALPDINGSDSNEKNKEDTLNKDELVSSILNNSSFNGKMIFYASYLSIKNEKSFSLEELFSNKRNYIYGYMVALSTIGAIKFTIKDEIVTILHLSKLIKEQITDKIKESAEKQDKKVGRDATDEKSWIKTVNDISEYFED